MATLTGHGLPCDDVADLIEDNEHVLWAYASCGMLRIPLADVDAWLADPHQRVRVAVLGDTDGVRLRMGALNYGPRFAKTQDGRLWFLPQDGVSVVDPRRIRSNPLPPPVHIERVTANGVSHDVLGATASLRLPSRIRDLGIEFTALSFTVPEKVRFRLQLDGQDVAPREQVNVRRVDYSNVAPGKYRFHVAAANDSGVWNETGASLDFSIAPAYYQTRWFAALVIVATACLLWMVYKLRVAQLAHQFNRTLEARVSERTRIARDLHDTLLQSLQGLLLQFQSAANLMRTRPDEAQTRLDHALDQAEAAIIEGRDTVRGLRASTVPLNDLANAIAAVGADLTTDPAVVNPPRIAVEVDGASRDLNPVVREEAYHLAIEAMRNAVKHAEARRIVVTIHYEPRYLRLTVRDDGRGIDADTISSQHREGHFGLPGMRERAAIVKGQLDVRSAPATGTEIELRVPSAIAYTQPERRWLWRGRAT